MFFLNPVNDLCYSAEHKKRSQVPWHPPLLVGVILYISTLVKELADFYHVQNTCSLQFTNLLTKILWVTQSTCI